VLFLGLAAAAALIRMPLVAVAEDKAIETDRARGTKTTKGEDDGIQIERRPVAVLDTSGGEVDVEAIAEVWKKLNPAGPRELDAAALAVVLRRIQGENAAANAKPSPLDAERPANRYNTLHPEPPGVVAAEHGSGPIQPVVAGDQIVDDAVATLRAAARKTESIAADLEDADLYGEADRLYGQAQALRTAARRMRRPNPASALDQAGSNGQRRD
jgi:hypothetical protein